jgi:hypothetical protein
MEFYVGHPKEYFIPCFLAVGHSFKRIFHWMATQFVPGEMRKK